MSFQNVKGTRDFYPPDMRRLNYILDAWRRVSLRNGFEEYDSPIFEYLDLFTAKSGPEIAEQLFSLEDRGGRLLAIRPEITPSLARMVNAKINALPRPIKWFAIPRLCRAEKPQKGRQREFFQWNIDIIGEDTELADAECVLVLVQALQELGLSSQDVAVRYSSRALLSEVLAALHVGQEVVPGMMAVLDKRTKLPADVFDKMLAETLPDQTARAGLLRFLDHRDLSAGASEVAGALGLELTEPMRLAVEKLQAFRRNLDAFGVGEWCVYDTGIVRGLAYYTGIVYEVFDRGESLRAVAGGGRYDNLLEVLGGPKVGACGFGMGDPVLGILLEEKQKLPADLTSSKLDVFVIDGEGGTMEGLLGVVAALRAKGVATDFSYKRQNIGKQLKEANRRGAARATIVAADSVVIKDLATGTQQQVGIKEFMDLPVVASGQGENRLIVSSVWSNYSVIGSESVPVIQRAPEVPEGDATHPILGVRSKPETRR